jgi:hypothetical protein
MRFKKKKTRRVRLPAHKVFFQISRSKYVRTFLIILGLLAIFGLEISAADRGNVIQVSYPLSLSSKEPQPNRDIYIDLGSKDGLSLGEVLLVSRDIVIGNAFGDGEADLVKGSIGELKIIALGEGISVARFVPKDISKSSEEPYSV